MKKTLQYAAMCSVIGMLACSSASAEETGMDNFSDPALQVNNTSLQFNDRFLLASASDTNGGSALNSGAAAAPEKNNLPRQRLPKQ